MAYVDRIRACTRHDLAHFLPLVVATERVGWVRRDRVAHLARHPDVFAVGADGVTLAPDLATPEARSAAVARVVDDLHAHALLPPRYDERFPVVRRLGESPRFVVERAAVTFLGVRAFGLHVNAFVEREDGLHVWVARRSDHVRVEPGKLDHLVAGGQPVGLGIEENLAKEAWEEAGIPVEDVRRAVPTGAVTYRLETADGLKDDVLFTFDLELPPAFVPSSQDGELDAFALWPVGELARVVRDTDRFKFNVGPVIIDFLVRRGLIRPQEPDYLEIVAGLHA